MTEESQGAKLYDLEIGHVLVTVRGKSPLLCNQFTDVVMKGIADAQEKKGNKVGGKPPRDPQAEYEGSIYRLEDGSPGFPAIAFKKAMVRAAKGSGMPMTDARGAFHVMGDLLPLRASDPVMRSDRVVIGRGITSIAYRSQFTRWEIDVPIEFNMRAISAEQLVNLLQVAGFAVGIGAWRPECDGNMGLFEVKA